MELALDLLLQIEEAGTDLRVCCGDGALDVLADDGAGKGGGDDHSEARAVGFDGELHGRDEGHWWGVVAQVAVLGVRDDPDDFKESGGVARLGLGADGLADGALSVEVAAYEGLVDDGHARGGLRVVVVEGASE